MRRMARLRSRFTSIAGSLVIMLSACPAGAEEQSVGTRAPLVREGCPPEGSSIALFSRQALDEGRKAEAAEYGNFWRELEIIAISNERLDDIIEKATAAFYRFSARMQASGHDIRPGDLVIDLQESLKDLIGPRSHSHPIHRARSELLGAIVAEVKKRICE